MDAKGGAALLFHSAFIPLGQKARCGFSSALAGIVSANVNCDATTIKHRHRSLLSPRPLPLFQALSLRLPRSQGLNRQVVAEPAREREVRASGCYKKTASEGRDGARRQLQRTRPSKTRSCGLPRLVSRGLPRRPAWRHSWQHRRLHGASARVSPLERTQGVELHVLRIAPEAISSCIGVHPKHAFA